MSIDVNQNISKLIEILKIEDKHSADIRSQFEKIFTEGYGIDINNLKEDDKEWIAIAKRHADEGIYIRKDSPFLIGAGTSQILFRLDDSTVAKSQYSHRNRNFSHYRISEGYEPGRMQTESILKQLGLNVPYHVYLHNASDSSKDALGDTKYTFQILDNDHERALFILTEDLTENGKFIVKEFEKNAIRTLDNRKQLAEEYKMFFDLLYGMRFQKENRNNQKYEITANNHLMRSTDYSEAINHLFLLKINPNTNKGELVAEDTNHLDIYLNSNFIL